MNSNVKKMSFAVLAGVAALAINKSANAALTVTDVITPASQTGENGDVYELVSFYLTGLTGVDTTAGTLGAGGALIGLSGNFSDSTTNGLWVPGAAATDAYAPWTKYITNGGEQAALGVSGGIYDSSFVNLDTDLSPNYDGTNGSETNSGTHHTVTAISGNATNFNASWGAVTGAGIDPGTVGGSANNLIAQVYALPGTKVSFTGTYVTYGTNGGLESFSTAAVGPTPQPIISLLSTAPTTYGSEAGTLTVTGKGNGSYNPTFLTISPADTTGYVGVSGFSPATDQEVYALKLGSNGGFTDSQIAAAINSNGAVGGLTASTVAGSAYAADFPGYDILLTGTNPSTVSSPDFLAFDFSQDTAQPGITVSAVAAVPEPATAAGIVLGTAGLLLGRRRNKLVVA